MRNMIFAAVVGVMTTVGQGQCTGGPNPITLVPGGFCGTGSGTHIISGNSMCQPFIVNPCQGHWNAVGVAPGHMTVITDRDLEIGTVQSTEANGRCDYVVANGHLGTITTTAGSTWRAAPTMPPPPRRSYARAANLRRPPQIAPHHWETGSLFWNIDSTIRLFEFEIECAGNYTVDLQSLNGADVSVLRWRLYKPGGGPQWRPRSQHDGQGNGGTASNPFNPSAPIWLEPGAHAVTVFKDGLPVPNTLANFRLVLKSTGTPATPNLSPSSSIPACMGVTSLNISGGNLTSCAPLTVMIDTTVVTANTTVTPNQLSITGLNQNLFNSPGSTLTVTINFPNGTPGGGSDTHLVVVDPVQPPSLGTPPTVFACSPTATSIVIPASNLYPLCTTATANGATISFSPNQVTVPIGANLMPGDTINVIVTNPGHTPAQRTITVQPLSDPSITSLVPSAVIVESPAQTIRIVGQNFRNTSEVEVDGMFRSSTMASNGDLLVTFNAMELMSIDTINIQVTDDCAANPSGIAMFNVVCPVPMNITSLAPATVTRGSAATGMVTVTVNGNGFLPTSEVRVDGSARMTTYVDPTELQFDLIPGDTAVQTTRMITVDDQCGTTAPATLTVACPSPNLTSLSPNSAIEGDASLTVSILGNNFCPSSTVEWNGVLRTPTYVSDTQLDLLITAAELATATTIPCVSSLLRRVVVSRTGRGTSAFAFPTPAPAKTSVCRPA